MSATFAKLLLAIALVAALGPAAADAGGPEPCWPPCASSSPPCGCDPELCCPPWRPPWYFRSEALLLKRDVEDAIALAALDSASAFAGGVVLSTADFPEPFSVGPRFLLGHTFADTPYQIEGSGFFQSEFNSQGAERQPLDPLAPDRLALPFDAFGNTFAGTEFVRVWEESQLQSQELNVRRTLPMPPGCLTVSILVGARHIGVDETMYYFADDDGVIPASTASLLTRTKNDLWGGQLGAMFEYYAQHGLWVNFEIKGGILNNSARQGTNGTLVGGPVSDLVVGEQFENGTAYSADFDLSVVYRCSRVLSTRIGYQGLWLDGLAIAARNLVQPAADLWAGSQQIDRRGTVFYHGPYAGLELTW